MARGFSYTVNPTTARAVTLSSKITAAATGIARKAINGFLISGAEDVKTQKAAHTVQVWAVQSYLIISC
jgi:hypothetical protein